MTKTNRIAFYIGEVFVITFFLTILMVLPFLFKASYSTPVERDFPELPFTTILLVIQEQLLIILMKHIVIVLVMVVIY